MTDTNITLSDELEKTVIDAIEKESAELTRLCNLVAEAAKIEMVNGQPVSSSSLTSDELEILAMRIPGECLHIQASINRYMANNVFRDLEIEAQVTQRAAALVGEKGNADERKRRAELEVLKERTVSLANKTIIKGLQSCIDRADKVYEGVKKVMDFRARESWFDRKGPSCPR